MASACLIKLISIGLSYRAREPRYTFTRAIATVQAFVSAPTFTISIWYRYASLLITMSETGPRAPFVGARLRSCTLTVTQPAPSTVRYASRLEISTIYPTGIGTRLTRVDRYFALPPGSIVMISVDWSLRTRHEKKSSRTLSAPVTKFPDFWLTFVDKLICWLIAQ